MQKIFQRQIPGDIDSHMIVIVFYFRSYQCEIGIFFGVESHF